MSRLTVVFHVSIYFLAALSSLMLALAEGTPFPAGLGVPLAVLALLLNERWRLLRLGTLWANALGVAALLLAGVELFGENLEARLLAGAHLLAYLLWIVLFLPKDGRHYWWMAALGVLHVAVGSVLTHDGVYGTLLVCYFFIAIWTLSVFSLYQAQRRVEHSSSPAHVALPGDTGTGRGARAGGSRATPVSWRSQAAGAIQRDPHEHWLSGRFVLGTIATSTTSMALAAVLFLLIPRNIWSSQFGTSAESEQPYGTPLTGFTEEISLGGFGEILESTEPVMEVQIFDAERRTTIDPVLYARSLGYDEPLFRGSVLLYYDGRDWKRGAPVAGQQFLTYNRFNNPLPEVLQEIRLQPIGTRILFGMQPIQGGRLEGGPGMGRRERIAVDPASHVISDPGNRRRNSILVYTLYSPRTAPRRDASYDSWRLRTPADRDAYLDEALRLPPGLERLSTLARQIARVDENPPPPEMAERIVSYLRDSGRFRYSLRSSVQDPTVDPVEDFLFNRHEGHCEYYASALALMLRSAGIPARLVTGFKGGEYDTSSETYVVQQRHAHAWVEAWLDGQWTTLDATPAAERTEAVASVEANLSAWSRLRASLSDGWSNYVVNMSFSQQQRRFYAPMREWLEDWQEAIEAKGGRAAALLSLLKEFLTNPSRWFSWQGAVFSFLLLILSAAFWWIGRRLWRVARRVRARYAAQQRRQRLYVAFFERFQRICAALGLVRGATQTPREFAAVVRRRWAGPLAPAGLGDLPERVADSFYRIRFGEEPLDPGAAEELESQLTRFEAILREAASVRT